MKFNKLLATGLATVTMLSVPTMAMSIDEATTSPTPEGTYAGEDSMRNYNMTYAEFVIATVQHLDGEQPLLMDTHYAMSYFLKAEELGLPVGEYDEEAWNEKVTFEQFSAIFEAVEDVTALQDALELVNIHSILVGDEIVASNVDFEMVNYQGQVLVPVRVVAEALGFEVNWNDDGYTRTVDLVSEDVEMRIELGFDAYQTNQDTQATSLNASPRIVGEMTYVPAAMFDLLLGEGAVQSEEGFLEINPIAE